VRLDRLATSSAGENDEWEDMRLKRILDDYMLRMSYYNTASKLAETSGIQVLTWWASQEEILLITRFM
jgi:macrophage erythroblast attacher